MAVARNPDLEEAYVDCKLKHELCTEWAIQGHCYSTGVHDMHMMATTCCPVCGSASQLDFLARCLMDPDAYTAYSKPGDVSKYFTRSLEKIDNKYEPRVYQFPLFEYYNNAERRACHVEQCVGH